MPPLPKLRIAALEELARQLRFAPAETLRRQLERAEQLAAEIDPAINYPEDWVVFRITGYRPDASDGGVIVGEALLGDVSALVERLSAAAGIAARELPPGQYLDADAVAARWSISRKTLERYRRQGLVARRVIGANRKPRLMFALAAVERFEQHQQARLGEAREFSRIEPSLQRQIIRRARAYHRAGLTLNQAAARLAERYQRGHETIRQMLKRHDAQAAEPIFAEKGPPTRRERELIERAWFLAIEPSLVARRLNRSTSSIHRVINDRRAARLRTLEVHAAAEAVAAGPECLSAPAAVTGLGPPGETDLLELLRSIRTIGAPSAKEERARAVAYQFLIARAAGAIAKLPSHGVKAADVDAVETDLRWAARLKAELVRLQLPLLVRTIESTLRAPPEEMRATDLIDLLREAIAAMAHAVDEFHPHKGGRLAAPVGLAVTRVVTRFGRARGPLPPRPRALPRVAPGIAIQDWTRAIASWQTYRGRVWLEPPAAVREGLPELDERGRQVLRHRFGWGERPRTQAELATLLGTTVIKVGPLERRALRAAAAVEPKAQSTQHASRNA